VHANGRHDINGNVIKGLAPQELAVTDSPKLGHRKPTIPLWKDLPKESRGDAPYSPPANHQYNTKGGPVDGKINVHLVPHTHDDTGWQVTVDQYFSSEVFYVIDTVIQNLLEDPNRKFIYVEIGFFARWWEEANPTKRENARKVVANGQLEFINGGWCMHDEASPLWTAMVDQTTRGHQFILKNFGKDASPRGTWQIDPFGHSNTEAWLLGAEAGMESLFWGRMDYQDRNMRFNKQEGQNGFEWIWQGSKSLGSSAQVFAGDLYGSGGGGYSTWINFDGSDTQVQDDPARHDYNVDQWVDQFVQDALSQANHTISEHQMWACGTDFQYQDADHWYNNLDKLIHHVNANGTVNVFYSTPSLYTDQKKKALAAGGEKYQVRPDDIFPLADDKHNYWSGYFTSRPGLKRQVRFSTNLLAAARMMEVVSNTTSAEVNTPTAKKSPPVGDSWTDSLEGTVGVATHHDGMSGTERQDVTDDYEQRISESSFEVEAGIALSLSKMLGVAAADLDHCNCNQASNCLNMSVCSATSGASGFSVVAWNPNGHTSHEVVRLPVMGTSWAVTDANGQSVQASVVDLDARTLGLPLLYLNSYGMNATQKQQALDQLKNQATHELVFEIEVPAVGFATYQCNSTAVHQEHAVVAERLDTSDGPMVVGNEMYDIEFNNGMMTKITNKVSGISTPFTIDWGWYNSSVGGCTDLSDVDPKIREPACSGQKSGAYIFRPNSSEVFYPGPKQVPKITVTKSAVVTEVSQQFSEWATHVVRLYKGQPYVEVEWTAGPIPIDTPWIDPVAFDKNKKPMDNNWGKEVIVRYTSGIQSGQTWYTDSNGKEMVKRVYNKRGPTYPSVYNISEPVAGNYYPVNALMSLDDGKMELAVLTDVSQGGSSLKDGQLELMVHRRIQDDDSRGVQEPLNETMCGCNDIGADPGKMGAHGHEGDGGCVCEGLTMRGKHWLVFDTINNAHETRRELAERINFPSTLSFSKTQIKAEHFSAVGQELPKNIKLVTLTNNYAGHNQGMLMLRLSHLYEAGEHPTLATPVEIDLKQVFAKAGLTITNAIETTLTGNKPLSEVSKFQWATVEPNPADPTPFETRIPFEFPKVTIRPMEVRTFMASFE
jgi:alpha-mannosidase